MELDKLALTNIVHNNTQKIDTNRNRSIQYSMSNEDRYMAKYAFDFFFASVCGQCMRKH